MAKHDGIDGLVCRKSKDGYQKELNWNKLVIIYNEIMQKNKNLV